MALQDTVNTWLNRGKKVVQGVGSGFYNEGVKPYTRLLGSSVDTLGSMALDQASRLAPLGSTPNRLLNQGAQNLAGRALAGRQTIGATGSIDQGNWGSTVAAGASATGRAALSAYGATQGLPALAGAGLIGGGLNATIAAFQQQDPFEAFGYGIGSAPLNAGLGGVSSNILGKVAPYVGWGVNKPGVGNMLYKGAGMGGFNILENEVATNLLDQRAPTNAERAISFGVGAGTSPFFKATSPGFAKPKVTKEPQVGDGQPRLKNGTYDKKPVLFPSDLVNMKKRDMRLIPTGQNTIKIDRRYGERKKFVGDPNVNNAAAGALFGVEPYQDEEGKTKFRFNTTNAALGVAGMALGTKALKRFPNEPQKLNVNRLKIDPEQQAQVRSLESTEPRTVLKNKDVIAASAFAEGRKTAITDTETKGKLAGQLVSRQKVVSLENQFKELKASGAAPEVLQQKIEEIAKQSKIARTEGTEAGRQLQARNILADETATPMQKVFKLLDNAGVKEEDYVKDAAGVDWDDAEQVVNFYRKFVPPSRRDWIDTIRYNSMLSSPLTGIVNAASGAINTTITPTVTKAVTGAVDFIGSAVTGKERTAYAGEAGAYLEGYAKNLPNAFNKFRETLKGKLNFENLDLEYMPVGTNTKAGKILTKYSLPTRLLESMDQFFIEAARGGERGAINYKTGKGIKVSDPEATALRKGKYWTYRQDLKDPDQNKLLDAVDEFTAGIQRFKHSDNPIVSTIASFTLPFVKTPMNILKQGVEYSPLGGFTAVGAKNPQEQFAKAIIGSTAIMATSMLVASGRSTWAEPTDAKKKQAFRDAGLQPYSIKIGNDWYSYSKLPSAIGYPIAFVAALNDARESKTIDQSDFDAILGAVAKSGKFFADQSYLKSIGDLLNGISDDPERWASMFANYPEQMIPYRAFMGWTSRLLDPYQRKVDYDKPFLEQLTQEMMKDIPGLSGNVPTRNNEFEEPIENQNRVFNAFSPSRKSTEKPEQKEYYDTLKEKALFNKNKNIVKKKLERGEEIPEGVFDVGATDEKPSSNSQVQAMREKMKLDMLKDKVRATGESQEVNGKLYYQTESGGVGTVTTDTKIEAPKLTGNKEVDAERIRDFKGEITSTVNKVLKLEKLKYISGDEANKRVEEIKKLESEVLKKKTGGGGKKGRSVDYRSILKTTPTKITAPKLQSFKAPRISTARIRNLRFKNKPLKLKKS